MSGLHFLTLTELSEQIRRRSISPVEVTRLCLDRINEYDNILSSYLTVIGDRALRQASLAEEEISKSHWRGPLHGVPMALKDLISTKGTVTTAGMSLYKDHVPAFDATVAERFDRAGAVILGKLKTTEGALFNHHRSIVPPRNPWHPDYWSGVSSSGSGVATAAGLCFGALGTDTAGSIRMPSSCCGLTGIKPTWGRVSRFGVFPLADSLDCVGPIARSAADAAAMLGVIAGTDANDPTAVQASVPGYVNHIGEDIRGLRIGIDHAFATRDVNEEVAAVMSQTAATFIGLGAEVCEIGMPSTDEVTDVFLTLCSAEAAAAHQKTYPLHAFAYGNELAEFIEKGRNTTAIQLAESLRERRRFAGRFSAVFSQIDVVLTPTLPFLVPRLDSIDFARMTMAPADGSGSSASLYSTALQFTLLFNLVGSPAISFPAGFSSAGLPIGLQLAGPHLGEELLFRAVHSFQKSTGWHARHPFG
jgi:amidase